MLRTRGTWRVKIYTLIENLGIFHHFADYAAG